MKNLTVAFTLHPPCHQEWRVHIPKFMAANGSTAPVFIVGAPRSGTTLVRTLLNRHPEIGLCDETFFFYYVAQRQRAFGDLADPRRRAVLIEAYLSTQRIRDLDLDLPRLSERLMEKAVDYRMFFSTLLRFYAEANGKLIWGEKTPHHASDADSLLTWFPDARIVHVVRDPRDVVASLLRMPWGARSAVRNARQWQRLSRPVDAPGRRFILSYEDLVADPEASMQRVCSFLGVPYDATMLTPDPEAVAIRPWFQRAHGPLTQKRVGTWKAALSPAQVQLVEWICRKEMELHGYGPEERPPSALIKLRGLLGAGLDALRSRALQGGRLWYYWFRPTALAEEERWLDRSSS